MRLGGQDQPPAVGLNRKVPWFPAEDPGQSETPTELDPSGSIHHSGAGSGREWRHLSIDGQALVPLCPCALVPLCPCALVLSHQRQVIAGVGGGRATGLHEAALACVVLVALGQAAGRIHVRDRPVALVWRNQRQDD